MKFIPTKIMNVLYIGMVLILSAQNVYAQSATVPTENKAARITLESSQKDSLSVFKRQQKKMDSLSKSTSEIVKKTSQKVDSLKRDFENRLTDKKKRVSRKLDSLSQKVHRKLKGNAAVDRNGLGGGKTDQLNETTEKLYSKIPKADAAKEKLGDLNLDKVEKYRNLPSEKLNEQLSKGSKPLEGFEHLTTKAKKYKEDIAEIKEGNPDKIDMEQVLEQKIQSLEGVTALEAKKAALSPQLESYKNTADPLSEINGIEKLKDSDALKPDRLRQSGEQQATNHIKVLATDYFTQHGDELNAAQDKLTKFKKKFGGLESITNVPTRPYRFGQDGKPNPLKGKTFGERLIIGGNFQIYKGKPFGLDISPQLAYKLTPKFRLGVGGVYRTSFGHDDIISPPNQPNGQISGSALPHGRERAAYGFSGYLAHDVYKSFYAHGEFEKLRTRQGKGLEEGSKPPGNWHQSAYLGIGKTYKISQKVKGNIMVLYDVLNDKTNPYRKPWNIRFGFQMVKREKEREKKRN